MAKATFETVVSAIEQLKKEGRSTTIAAIQAITGGSNSTIVTLKQRYENERPTIAATRTININPAISELIAGEISRAAAEAGAEAGQRRAEVEADMLRVAEEAEATAAALEAAQQQIIQLQSQVQQMAGTIEQLKADAEAVKVDAAKQIANEQQRAREAIMKAETESARERSERESAQMELAKAGLRLESLPKLEAEIVRLQGALEAERTGRSSAEAGKAAAEAKVNGLADRLADCQVQSEKAVAVAGERLLEQSRSCSELTSTLKDEIQSLQQRLVESVKPVEKPAAE